MNQGSDGLESDTSGTDSITSSSGRSSPELSVQEQLNPLSFASMPERRAESPDKEKNSYVEKELKRKRGSDSSLQHSDSSDTEKDKKPRGR